MEMLIRPYNADGPRLLSAIRDGVRLDGIIIDAHIAKFARNAAIETREQLPDGVEFLVDPVTHKLQAPFFRGKIRTYQRLPYYFTKRYGTRAPRNRELDDLAAVGAQAALDVQQEFGATAYVSPYLYANTNCFNGGGAPTTFSVSVRWAEEFLKLTGKSDTYFSLCVAADCMTDPDALGEIQQAVRRLRARRMYLLVTDFELGNNTTLDDGMRVLLQMLRKAGVEQILYSHAPAWVYFLEPHGVNGFVTGINYLSTLKEEYMTRRDEIGGITHNYYIARRFCRMTPAQATEAIDLGLLEACECPVCEGGVPDATNAIREHYIHARAAECQELRDAPRASEVLRRWVEETVEFLAEVDAQGLKVLGDPKPTQWAEMLP
jgi:hypothetical protein